MKKNKVFLAVTSNNYYDSIDTIKQLAPELAGIKLGLDFFFEQGPKGVEIFKHYFNDIPLMLDLKLHDTPDTIKIAINTLINNCEIDYLTIDAMGGYEMLKAAMKASNRWFTPIAVCTLTSLDESDYVVKDRIKDAQQADYNHFVLPVDYVMMAENSDIIFSPGIRLDGDNKDDHTRSFSPTDIGSDIINYYVVGRPIMDADNPLEKLREYNE